MTSLMLALVLVAAPPSPELLREAQEALAKGDTAAAIEKYEAATHSADPASAPLTYNLAVAKYRAGAFRDASTLFRDAASGAPGSLAAKAMFNQATSIYADALGKLASPEPAAPAAGSIAPDGKPTAPAVDPKAVEEAIAILEQSMTHFRDAIKADPSDIDSRVNAEKAWKLLQTLKREQERQEKKEEKNDKQDQQDQGDQKDEKNKEKQDPSQQQNPDQQQQQQDQGQDGKQGEQSPKDQKQKDQQQKEGQQSDQNQKDQKDQKDQKQEQQSAAEQKEQEAQNDQQQQQKEAQAQRARVSQQDAERLLQMVRDKEKLRRAALLAKQRGKQPPVSRDW